MRRSLVVAAVALTLAPALRAQALPGKAGASIPPVKTPVTAADLRIVQRAAEIVDSPKKWNPSDTEDCPTGADAFTLYCALAKAAEEVSGKVDARSAAIQEAEVTIDLISAKKYGSPLADFNHDRATSFTDVQEFLRILRNRLTLRMSEEAAPATQGAPPEEWRSRPPVTQTDVRIVRRAKEVLGSPSVWNRADTRVCPQEAKTFSLYCALEKATQELSGKFEHRSAAMQEARFVIEDIAPNVLYYEHRLKDYNNDPSTTFFDVQKFFQLLEDRIAKRMTEEHAPKTSK